ncbi:bud neck involved protein [Neofusicoccum ribis]|uniref:Bud neck involved protein n=1 Tax=Neofusicoccum ribis TaxID=45134 RepID=A0ABR3TEF6_9PEZI
MPRTQYYNTSGGGIGYRGSSATPVQTYAFQQTPQLRPENRSTSAPVNPYSQAQAFQPTLAPTKQGHATHPSSSSGSTASSSSSNQSSTRQRSGSKDDSALSHQRAKSADDLLRKPNATMDSSRQISAINLSTSVPDLTLTSFETTAKSSPDRYRRSRNVSGPASPPLPQESKSAAPSGSGMAGVAHLYKGNGLSPRPGHNRTSSMDDSTLPRSNSEQAKRYRRRSLGGFEGIPAQQGAPSWAPPQQSRQDAKLGAHKNNSGESISSASNSTRPSSSKRENAARPSSPKVGQESRSPNVPARGSSADATKRIANPSPLSKATSDGEPPSSSGKASATDASAGARSPAAQQLAALNEKEKGVKSRLRRAFSFGSAAELRKASAENASTARMNQQRGQQQDDIDPEDAAIAAKQEAAGIGNSIYSGQGGVFSGSTDNLSISSTASSASIMLRKMGKGMKKGGRSLKGLFRPKSVIGVPAADSAVQPSVAQVSMVTVEAERENVNVNAHPADHAGGGTGFPKLERNSLDASLVSERPSSVNGTNDSRKSIMGGERERAEVLAAVRKGILKRDDNRALGGDDYFVGASRFAAGSSRSLPNTPHGGPRNISFSPRIQFHDAWSSSEYDRRGDIATCNRLTPMLAQQIKEELNTFKMVGKSLSA